MRSALVRLGVGLVVASCGNSNVLTTDGGLDAASDVLTCLAPADAAPFAESKMNPPNPSGSNKCNATQAADYAACNAGQVQNKCGQFTSGQPGFACAQCIESQITSATWGVIVFDGKRGTINIPGCVDLALQQVGSEPNSCGQLLYASYACQNFICSACTGADFATCDTLTLAGPGRRFGACAAYDDQVRSATGPCSALFASDVLPATAMSCFPDTTIADPTMQEVDVLTHIITFMCGGP